MRVIIQDVAYNHFDSGNKLDNAFLKIIERWCAYLKNPHCNIVKIQHFEKEEYHSSTKKKHSLKQKNHFDNKIDAIRVEQWIVKLAQFWYDDRLRRNRNSYAEMLELWCKHKQLKWDFKKVPPDSELPLLLKHDIDMFKSSFIEPKETKIQKVYKRKEAAKEIEALK